MRRHNKTQSRLKDEWQASRKKTSLFPPRLTSQTVPSTMWKERYSCGWKIIHALNREERCIAAFVDEADADTFLRRKRRH